MAKSFAADGAEIGFELFRLDPTAFRLALQIDTLNGQTGHEHHFPPFCLPSAHDLDVSSPEQQKKHGRKYKVTA